MSIYTGLPVFDPAQTVEVGYDAENACYWYCVYQDELVSGALELRTLSSLVRQTWAYIDWSEAIETVRALRDDAAWVADAKDDQATKFLASALSAQFLDDGDRLLTPDEAAAYLNVGLRFIRRIVAERRVPYVKVGRMVRLRKSDLDAYIQANTVPKDQRKKNVRIAGRVLHAST